MSFAADVSKWCRETVPEQHKRVVRRVVAEIANRAVMRSPVGNPSEWESPAPPGYAGGRFRGNWQYGFGSAPTGTIDAIDPSGSATLSGIISSVANNQGVHWIANNLPYAQRIEGGWSKTQAPFGIVGLIELEFPQIFNAARAQG
jgi:hypothetical protein